MSKEKIMELAKAWEEACFDDGYQDRNTSHNSDEAKADLESYLKREEAQTVEPAKRWPFVETPGEFTDRIWAAHSQFGSLLAAVRHVLIENPPEMVNTAQPPRGEPACPSCNAQGLMFECIACGHNNSPPKSEQGVCTEFDAPEAPVTQPLSTEREVLLHHLAGHIGWANGMGYSRLSESLHQATDMLAADAQRYSELFYTYHDTCSNLAHAEARVQELKSDLQELKAHQVAVPKGWKMAPVEPTTEMTNAYTNSPHSDNEVNEAYGAWSAMLAASPKPPQAERVPMTKDWLHNKWRDALLASYNDDDLEAYEFFAIAIEERIKGGRP